jgi:peptidyl-prolyl cis-trans isomerase SurA
MTKLKSKSLAMTMKYLRPIVTLACLALWAAAAGAQGITQIMRSVPLLPPAPSAARAAPEVQQTAEYIVALVDSEPITNTEVQQRLIRTLSENPQAEQMPREALTRLVLERLISERAMLHVAKESGIKVDDLAVDQAEENVARANQLPVAELRRRVAASGLSQEQFRRELRDQIALTRLRDNEVEAKVKISDAEVDRFIREQREGAVASAPPEINIAHLLVAVPESASEAEAAKLQQRAQGLAERARAGEDFGKLAQENSNAPDRAGGGVLGLRSADRYPELFVEATRSLPVGGIAGPVRSGAGFHVLKLLARSQPGAGNAVVTQTHARHILLRIDAKRTTAQAVADLNDFKARIQRGVADFAGLARDYSEDGSAPGGGDLGWTRPGQFVPEFEEAMNRLAPSQISEPVISRFGAHLIQVLARREAELSQAEQREAARATLRERRIEQNAEVWAQEVRARAYVEYRGRPVAE